MFVNDQDMQVAVVCRQLLSCKCRDSRKMIRKWITGKPNTGKQQRCKRLFFFALQVDESVTRGL